MLSAQDLLVTDAVDKPREFSEIAVLYRTHRQADLLEKCLRQEGIPCVIAGRDDFLSAPCVRGALAFFRFLTQPEDSFALFVSLQFLFACPPDLCENIAKQWDMQRELPLSERLGRLKTEWESAGHLLQFLQAAEAYLPRIHERPRKLLDSFAKEYGLTRENSFTRLRSAAVFHKRMEEFLQAMSLGEEGDILRGGAKSYAAGAVTLMTLHGAKGLEFPVVFVCGVNQGMLPYESEQKKADTQEERRLFFVGMTRAKEELVLLTSPEPSAFLEEIPSRHCVKEQAAKPKEEAPALQLSLF